MRVCMCTCVCVCMLTGICVYALRMFFPIHAVIKKLALDSENITLTSPSVQQINISLPVTKGDFLYIVAVLPTQGGPGKEFDFQGHIKFAIVGVLFQT